MNKFLTLFILMLFSGHLLMSQGISGEIQGRVTDEATGEGIPFCNVTMTINGTLAGAQTDFDGFYSIKPVPPGSYDVTVSYIGYQTSLTQGVLVVADKITFLDIPLGTQSELLDEIVIKEYKVPLIKQDETSTGTTVTREDIDNLPTRNVSSVASTSAGVYQSDEGEDLNVKGSRSESTDFYIDGIKVRGTSAVPIQAVEQVSVLTGGVPARYGDATGGIINITTRGPSNQFAGGVEILTSQFLDPYGYNLATASLSGPLLRVNKGTDAERPILGLFLAGEYLREKDDDPSAIGNWILKDEVTEEITNNPLVVLPSGGFARATEFLTADDLENIKYKRNVVKDAIGATAKIDFQPIRNINVTIGGTFNYQDRNNWINSYALMNPEGNDQTIDQTYRGYVRFTQRFGQSSLDQTELEASEQSLFSNAFYSIQLDYTKDLETRQNDRHKDNIFDYGYVGRFDVATQAAFNAGSALGGVNPTLASLNDSGVTFTPGTQNPALAAHTSQFFDLLGGNTDIVRSVFDIEQNAGLINGTRVASLQSAYSIWYNPGRIVNEYRKNEDDQYRLVFNGSVDIKKRGSSDRNKHAVEFGFEYEQRVDREFRVFPVGLWNIMRLRANPHIEFDNTPLLVVRNLEGEQVPYTYNDFLTDNIDPANADTITAAAYANSGGTVGNEDLIVFDNIVADDPDRIAQSIRSQLGASANSLVNIDALDPDFFSLDMFSADELFNGGQDNMVDYYGYSYTGEKLTTQPAFADFFSRKGENGDFTRDIPAFRPIYTAGYVQDKFSYKDLVFNIGVRVDRFDANQKVLKDSRSLYGVRSVEEVDGSLNSDNNGAHPASVGSDWSVYVNSATDPTKITGYRDGDNWYNSAGEFIEDPLELTGQTTNPVPYVSIPDGATNNPVTYIKDESFDSNVSFEDYEPQISVMPRIAFSFNMSENAQFFAHYDQLTQRPQTRLVATAFDYYFLQERSTRVVNNPNLRPEKTIDYQVGFRQRLSKSSALTIAGFYRELKDMIQVQRFDFAYPTTYTTFGNQDFATIKGLEFTYDLRRTGNLKLFTTYTLQFADGTGSDDASGFNAVDLGNGQLRQIRPLNYDSRHNIVAQIDYRFDDGKKYNGPKLFGKDILSNFGANVILRARSGEPYTKQSNPTREIVIGVRDRSLLDGNINGSRLPWNTKVDLRLDKDFVFQTGKKDGKSPKDNIVSIYLQVQNLFDQDNIQSVYSFTGTPGDDGWINSTLGQIDSEVQIDPQSYIDLYNVRVDDPDNYSRPRTIRLGAAFNF